ncbi:MAG: gamma-glutamyltransferase [Phenylobacterium sp.]|uniref:gamma-glutamyltransferase n=1 Tax=Phenylobacterium sp. TaxID=1871053 RepID=UPI0027340CE5|nr:gamma-glutamyltransferase [Phenylobacterium sp.]MDP3175438.1 gamma-glutamyltransferase [Phenylobacterium sp.]
MNAESPQSPKQPVLASRAVASTNHPVASTVALSMIANGGSAADAAIAAAFALTIVEPMMVGPLGGGYIVHRSAEGVFTAIDNYAAGPARAAPDMYPLEPEKGPLAVRDRLNEVGRLAAGVPGNLKGWLALHAAKGRLPLAEVLAPAIAYAENGFTASAYTVECITASAEDLAGDPDAARIYLPGGVPPKPGDRIVNAEAAATFRLIQREGADALYHGAIGEALVRDHAAKGGLITQADLDAYEVRTPPPIVGTYRGYEIVGTPPSSGGGLLNQLGLNILENFDVAALGFGTARYWHLLTEVLKIMYADRARYLGDPEHVSFPQAFLLDKDYAAKRAKDINLDRASSFTAGEFADWRESKNTTHLTVMLADGETVTMTQTLNNLFGSCVMVPGTGLMQNNNMTLFDPRPNLPNSPAPGKRMLTATAATVVQKDGKPVMALGTPGGLRIFPTVLQGMINVLDHGMTLQESVDAPRIWCAGGALEVEPGVPQSVCHELTAMGHTIARSERIAGGMNGVQVDATTGLLHGAACWRADGSPAGLSGGPATPGNLFGASPYAMR